MSGVRPLRKIQLGSEATPGTAVAATTIWRGKGTLEDTLKMNFTAADEDIGMMVPVDRSNISLLGGKLQFASSVAGFEQLSYVLNAGVKYVAAGAADGAGSDKIWTHDSPTTSQGTFRTYTIEGGDDLGAERMEYAFVTDFELSASPGAELMLSANWEGRQVAPNAFTGALTIPTIEDILFQRSKMYIDAVGGTLGSTQVTSTFFGMSLKYSTGLVSVPTGDGNLYFTLVNRATKPEAVFECTFLHNASSIAEKVNWRAQTPRLVQVKFEGSNVALGGTTYQKKTLLLNMAGKWEKFDKIDESNGNDVVKGTFRCLYEATPALFCTFVVVNELAALP